MALGDRLKERENGDETVLGVGKSVAGNKTAIFRAKKSAKESEYQRKLREHQEERRKIRRSTRGVAPDKRKARAIFWRGRRIK
jgi:hypothetical protein